MHKQLYIVITTCKHFQFTCTISRNAYMNVIALFSVQTNKPAVSKFVPDCLLHVALP